MKSVTMFIRWFFGLGPPKPPQFGRIDLESWRSMDAFEVKVLRDEEGNSWGVMQLDDLDHVIDLAKLSRHKRPTDPTSGEVSK